MSWDKVRRAQMRWRVECEECSVKCGAWRAQCEVWSVKCEVWSGVWRKQWEVWSVDCEVWNSECEVWSVEWEECSVKCGVWSVKCGVWRVHSEVWSAKWSFKCDMWSRTPLSQSARTHGLGWCTAHASAINEKGLIHISLRQLPPRLVRVLLVYIIRSYLVKNNVYIYIYIILYAYISHWFPLFVILYIISPLIYIIPICFIYFVE